MSQILNLCTVNTHESDLAWKVFKWFCMKSVEKIQDNFYEHGEHFEHQSCQLNEPTSSQHAAASHQDTAAPMMRTQ